MDLKFILKRYRFVIIWLVVIIAIYLFNNSFGLKIFSNIKSSVIQMLSVLPPIMIMLGLIDVWVSRESMMKYMGKESGIVGVALSILIASLAAGPMYAAFPFTKVLSDKGVKLSNIMIFLNAWCVIKLSTILFEIGGLGYKFTFVRFLIDLPGVIVMGYLIEYLDNKKFFSKKSKNKSY